MIISPPNSKSWLAKMASLWQPKSGYSLPKPANLDQINETLDKVNKAVEANTKAINQLTKYLEDKGL